ncbi:MAG: hypothetical protein PHT02_06355 [Tissierellia bacterium]|nr:hypothetical protein [Tissierellia bacterium]
MKKVISILLIMLMVTSINTFAFSEMNVKENVFIANDEQLIIINELVNKNLSMGEVFSIVCPEFLEKLESKDMLYDEPFDKDIINNSQEYIYASSPHVANITNYGNSIKFSSSIDTGFTRPNINIEARIYNRNTGEIGAYAWKELENSTGIDVVGIADPPTGTYYTWSQAKWIYDHTGHWETSNATSVDLYYYNPFQ